MTAVQIVDVGPRDGLQILSQVVSPPVRAELVARLAGAGLRRVEAVSFVHPTRVPQMAGAEEVVRALPRDERLRVSGLVLNERGYDRLAASGLPEVRFALAVSDAFSERNSGVSTAAALEAARAIVRRARADGRLTGVVLATAFGCPFSGEVDPARVARLAEQLAAAGVDEIVFADTIGVAVPRQVRRLLKDAQDLGPTLGVHLHNTRNTGHLNAFVAIEAGAEVLDASVGGLGGCPFAPGATGNIATEDLVFLLEREGIATGVDLDRLVAVAHWLRDDVGLALDGQLQRVGGFPPQAARS
jgi:hydroxymethylglutaryl-CoA lyase/(R)-citramalyl-CoA lyase